MRPRASRAIDVVAAACAAWLNGAALHAEPWPGFRGPTGFVLALVARSGREAAAGAIAWRQRSAPRSPRRRSTRMAGSNC